MRMRVGGNAIDSSVYVANQVRALPNSYSMHSAELCAQDVSDGAVDRPQRKQQQPACQLLIRGALRFRTCTTSIHLVQVFKALKNFSDTLGGVEYLMGAYNVDAGLLHPHWLRQASAWETLQTQVSISSPALRSSCSVTR